MQAGRYVGRYAGRCCRYIYAHAYAYAYECMTDRLNRYARAEWKEEQN